MKKIILTLILLSISNLSYAGSCPMLLNKIDGKLSEIEKLRDERKKAHDSGDHAKSEELLKKAISMLNN